MFIAEYGYCSAGFPFIVRYFSHSWARQANIVPIRYILTTSCSLVLFFRQPNCVTYINQRKNYGQWFGFCCGFHSGWLRLKWNKLPFEMHINLKNQLHVLSWTCPFSVVSWSSQIKGTSLMKWANLGIQWVEWCATCFTSVENQYSWNEFKSDGYNSLLPCRND